MEIIGHRGAAGLAPENTLAAIKKAIATGVDAIEFDVRLTKDHHLILSHDPTLNRITEKQAAVIRSLPSPALRRQLTRFLNWFTGTGVAIKSLPAAAVQQLPTLSGEPIPTLHEALEVTGGTSIIIEAKDAGWARPLADIVKSSKKRRQISVIAFNHRELYTFGQLCPDTPLYALEKTSGFDAIRTARLLGFAGIDLNFWLMNPLVYLLARHYKLKIIVYSINRLRIARVMAMFYPHISITSDVPDLMQKLRKHPPRRQDN